MNGKNYTGLLAVVAVVAIVLLWLNARPPAASRLDGVYAQSYANKHAAALQPAANIDTLDQPLFSDEEITDWLTTTIARDMQYDGGDQLARLDRFAAAFTLQGWGDYLAALRDTRLLELLAERRTGMFVSIDGPAIIRNRGVERKTQTYVWQVEIPATLKYGEGIGDMKSRLLLQVRRAPAHESAKGIGIGRFILDTSNTIP